MNEALMRIAVYAAAFLELCDDETLDPDTAVRQLEWIAAELRNLDAEARETLIAFARREAEGERDPDLQAFLLQFPEGLGLVDESQSRHISPD